VGSYSIVRRFIVVQAARRRHAQSGAAKRPRERAVVFVVDKKEITGATAAQSGCLWRCFWGELLNLSPTLTPGLAFPTPPPAGPGNFSGKTLETHPNNRVSRRLTTDGPRPQSLSNPTRQGARTCRIFDHFYDLASLPCLSRTLYSIFALIKRRR
jgi:hypothetical protein